MNTMKFQHYFYFFLLIVFAACSSGKTALQKGNYDEAVLLAVNRLRSSPENKKATQTLREAYPFAINWHANRISQLKNTLEAFKWEKVLFHYDKMTYLNNEILRCPACLPLVESPKNYQQEANEARNFATIERYEAADKLMNDPTRNRQMARKAFEHFQVVQDLMPNYKDVQKRMEEARFYATLKIVVEQIPVNSRTFSLSDEFFRNKIYEYISTNPRMNDFVRFYTPTEAMAQNLRNPDQIVRLQFDDFVVGQTFMNTNTETVTSKDSVKVGEVKVDGKNIAVFNRVTAKITTNRKTIVSKGFLDMQILDAYSGQVIHQDKMLGEFQWSSEWANFNGDERALTAQQIQLCRRREIPPPPPQDLFVEFCRPLYEQATQRIRNYYRNF